MNPPANAPSRIVILAAIDNTTASEVVVRTSALLGQSLANVELHLVHVLEPLVVGGPEAILPSPVNELTAIARENLASVTTRARELFSGRIMTHLAVGSPWREILQLASDLHADTIVVGSHRRKMMERWLIGSVSEQIVRKASCAVIVARPKDYSSGIPEIELPCPDCLDAQKESAGNTLWCVHHSQRHVHGHARYEVAPSFAQGSTFLRPEG